MKITIDATRAIIEQAGIGRIIRELVKEMIRIDHENHYELLFSFGRRDAKKEAMINEFRAPNVSIRRYYLPGMLKEMLWLRNLPWWYNIVIGRTDVFFAPSIFEVNLSLKKIPQVLIIYDLTTFLFPAHQGESKAKGTNFRAKKAIECAQKIIAISRATKNDLEKILKVEPKKIEIVYPGLTPFLEIAPKLPEGLKKQQYVLSCGTIEPRKNLLNLMKAHQMHSKNLRQKYPLVIVGQSGWNNQAEFRAMTKDPFFKYLGRVDDKILARLYQDASLFVYPSLYEGFGLPIIEAMHFGVPVITSNISSMSEAAGKAGILLNPNKVQEIAAKIKKVLEGKIDRKKIAVLGKSQAAKFSWEKAAYETIAVLKKVKSKDSKV